MTSAILLCTAYAVLALVVNGVFWFAGPKTEGKS